MNVLVWSSRFEAWFRGLADEQAQDRIVGRLARIRLGNFGDVKAVGEGVREMRIDAGPGYRVYFVRRGAAVYVLLTGGDKRFADARHRSGESDGARAQGGRPVKTEFKPFDVAADYLVSEERIAGYLSAAAEDEDPNVLLLALCDAAKARGMMEVAKAAGLNRESLYKALKPGAHPRFETVQAVLRALGVKLSVSARAADAGDEARLTYKEAIETEMIRAGEQMSAVVRDQVALMGADKSSTAQAKETAARRVTIDDFFRPGTVRNKGKAAEPVGKAEPAGKKARTQTLPRGRERFR
jgi:probable addiction module antidote protein/putative addiction module killer protein